MEIVGYQTAVPVETDFEELKSVITEAVKLDVFVKGQFLVIQDDQYRKAGIPIRHVFLIPLAEVNDALDDRR